MSGRQTGGSTRRPWLGEWPFTVVINMLVQPCLRRLLGAIRDRHCGAAACILRRMRINLLVLFLLLLFAFLLLVLLPALVGSSAPTHGGRCCRRGRPLLLALLFALHLVPPLLSFNGLHDVVSPRLPSIVERRVAVRVRRREVGVRVEQKLNAACAPVTRLEQQRMNAHIIETRGTRRGGDVQGISLQKQLVGSSSGRNSCGAGEHALRRREPWSLRCAWRRQGFPCAAGGWRWHRARTRTPRRVACAHPWH